MKRTNLNEDKTYQIEAVHKKLNPHLIKQRLMDLEAGFDIITREPITLICAERFDLLAKYVYALFWKNNIESKWGENLYCNHIYAFNKYKEEDGSKKEGKHSFLDSFNILLNSIETEGFNNDISVVPISPDNILIDGAHRTAACLAYGKQLKCLQLKAHSSLKYDYSYFLNKGMDIKYADYVAFQYCKIVKNTYIAVIFPRASGGESKISEIFQKFGTIVYTKEIELSKNGLFNLTKQIYSNETWCGTWKNNFKGAREKSLQCFREKHKTRIILLESNSIEKVKQAKAEIRSFFGIGNHSIHINDTHEEANHLAQMLLNENSIHFLNTANLKNYRENYRLLDEFKSTIEKQDADTEFFCIDGSFTMAVYGIREANDLDFLHHTSEQIRFLNPCISDHNLEIIHHAKAKDDLIFNPENHFYYQGIKFLSLDNLYIMKLKRGELKDLNDCRLIDNFNSQKSNTMSFFFCRLRNIGRASFHRLATKLKTKARKYLSKKRLVTLGIYSKISKKMRRKLIYVTDIFRPFIRTVEYKNTSLYYSKGTSIVEGHSASSVRLGDTYEPLETGAIIDRLRDNEKPIFVDIGANIGLISINVLEALPKAKIYAFEPGLHQYSLFKKTIAENSLEKRVILSQQAIGRENGELSFAVHDNKHSSGDGFFDTKRAGTSKTFPVEVTTLDTWWQSVSHIKVDVVKMDIEGAELWALEGAEKLISVCKPFILLEIHPVNLIPYPYSANDIVSWIDSHGYNLSSLSGISIDCKNIKDVLKYETSFIATTQ